MDLRKSKMTEMSRETGIFCHESRFSLPRQIRIRSISSSVISSLVRS